MQASIVYVTPTRWYDRQRQIFVRRDGTGPVPAPRFVYFGGSASVLAACLGMPLDQAEELWNDWQQPNPHVRHPSVSRFADPDRHCRMPRTHRKRYTPLEATDSLHCHKTHQNRRRKWRPKEQWRKAQTQRSKDKDQRVASVWQ